MRGQGTEKVVPIQAPRHNRLETTLHYLNSKLDYRSDGPDGLARENPRFSADKKPHMAQSRSGGDAKENLRPTLGISRGFLRLPLPINNTD